MQVPTDSGDITDIRPFFAKKLLFVTGKGGIGKSSLTAALGQAAAAAGKRVLLVESAADDHLAPLFGLAPVGHVETMVAQRLSLVNLSAPETFREYVVKYLGQTALFEKVFTNRVVESFINTIPGFAEVMMLGRLFYSAELAPGPRHDLLIFDGYASGHFLSLMTTPDAVIASTLGGPVVKETERVRSFLADPAKCGVIYVAVPEDLVVSESLEFLPLLAERSPARLAGLVVNRMPQAPLPREPAQRDAAWQYATTRRANAEAALAALKQGAQLLKERGLDLPFFVLPELGFIKEPLEPEFGPTLWSKSQVGGTP